MLICCHVKCGSALVATPPSQYVPYEQSAAAGTGLPITVVEAQSSLESGDNPSATSSAGAEGYWQFLPSTYNQYAAQAGVPQGTEYNVADETKVYIAYMNALLKQEGGSIYKALEAYNAGPGNLAAGAGYANRIMSDAGVPVSATAGTASATLASSIQPAQTTGIVNSILGPLDPATWISDLGKAVMSVFGLSSIKDMMQRLGLILFGVALILVGIRILTGGSSGKQTINVSGKTGKSTAGEAAEVAEVA